MAIASIQSWIKNGCNYTEGITLCIEFSDNEALIEMLHAGPDDFNKRQLYKELKRIEEESGDQVQELPSTEKRVEQRDFKIISDSAFPKWDSENFPADITVMKERAGEISRKLKYLRPQLSTVQTDQERLELCKQIIPLAKARQKLYNNIDYYNEYNKLPDPQENAEPVKIKKADWKDMTEVQLMQHYKNLASRICKSKDKGDLVKANALEAERQEVKQKLGIK